MRRNPTNPKRGGNGTGKTFQKRRWVGEPTRFFLRKQHLPSRAELLRDDALCFGLFKIALLRKRQVPLTYKTQDNIYPVKDALTHPRRKACMYLVPFGILSPPFCCNHRTCPLCHLSQILKARTRPSSVHTNHRSLLNFLLRAIARLVWHYYSPKARQPHFTLVGCVVRKPSGSHL